MIAAFLSGWRGHPTALAEVVPVLPDGDACAIAPGPAFRTADRARRELCQIFHAGAARRAAKAGQGARAAAHLRTLLEIEKGN